VSDFNQLAAPRFAEAVRRLLGEDIQLATVAPELAPYISLESDRPEWQVLLNETPWFASHTLAATVGSFSSVGIGVAANMLAVVLGIIILNNTAGALTFKFGMTLPRLSDADSGIASRDLRRLTVSSVRSVRTQAADQLPSVQPISIPPNDSRIILIPWMLTGSAGVIVEGGVVNQAVSAHFWGYERALRVEEQKVD